MQRQTTAYPVRFAQSDADVIACQQLRHRCFFSGMGLDADAFDPVFQHLMVTDAAGVSVATLRLRLSDGSGLRDGYAGQFYDLSALACRAPRAMEIGRMCTDPALTDPHVLRVLWGALTQIADHADVAFIFGCSSFAGTNPAPHATSFARLAARYLAPAGYGPFHKAQPRVALASVEGDGIAQQPMPPLLRSYLAMGGWVSDHAVIDPLMQTLHVLTGLETAKVPAARAAALRALAADSPVVMPIAVPATI